MSLEALRRNGHNLEFACADGVGAFGIPPLSPVQFDRQLDWCAFNNFRSVDDRECTGIHFFIDDYLFARVWNDPVRYADLLGGFGAVMTPDFSLFTDYPPAVQIYNHYRKHLLGAYWQWLGLTVIPTICWSDESSFDWCFDGEPVGSTVAISSVGTQKNPAARQLFIRGYNEMLLRLRPVRIIFFGDVPPECGGIIEHHDPFYKAVHARKRR